MILPNGRPTVEELRGLHPDWFRLFPTDSACFRLIPLVSDWFRLIPTWSDLIPAGTDMIPTGSDLIPTWFRPDSGLSQTDSEQLPTIPANNQISVENPPSFHHSGIHNVLTPNSDFERNRPQRTHKTNERRPRTPRSGVLGLRLENAVCVLQKNTFVLRAIIV